MRVIKLVNLLVILPPLCTAIVNLINQFETPGHGPEKKQAVLDVIGELFQGFESVVIDTPLVKEDVLNLASRLIDLIVAFYNTIGKFKHGSPETQEA